MGKCGFPLCRERLCPAAPPPPRTLSYATKTIITHDQETSSFCSPDCERRAADLSRKIASSAKFAAPPPSSSSSVADVIRSISVAVEDLPPPPAFLNPLISPVGAVLAQTSDAGSDPSFDVGSAQTKTHKRVRQLKDRIVKESLLPPAAHGDVGDLVSAFSARFGLSDPAPATALSTGGAQVTFAALNYGATQQMPSQASTAAASSASQQSGGKKQRGAKIVSWRADVKEEEMLPGKKVAKRGTGSDGQILGAVVEKPSEAPRPLPVAPDADVHTLVEGHKPSGGRVAPPVKQLARHRMDEESEDEGSFASADDASESDATSMESGEYSASLSVFSLLWLVSDDVFGAALPLHVPCAADPEDAADPEEVARAHPALWRGLARMEEALLVSGLGCAALETYRRDLEGTKRRMSASACTSSLTLGAAEWEALALLLLDGLLRRRGVCLDPQVEPLLQVVAGRSERSRGEALSARELFHLRNAFCAMPGDLSS